MTRTEIIKLLKQRQNGRTLTEFAKELKVSAPFLSDVYAGNRNPGPKLLKALGMVKEISFVRSK